MRGLSQLPAPWIDLARRARTAVLWAAGPIDRLLLGSGRGGLPPLWLRRHAGPIAKFSSSARETSDLIARLALLENADRVLDAGCGAGAMTAEFQNLLEPEGRYLGFDVHAPSIRWCRRRFAPDPRLRFELLRMRTPYSRGAKRGSLPVRFPMDDGGCGFVIAKSLFTHLLEPEASPFLREIARVLESGGAALVTAFLFDPASEVPAFPFSANAGRVRWKIRRRPHAAVAYSRDFFESLVSSAGLRVDRRIDGFYPGTASPPSGQDTLILRKEESASPPRRPAREP